MSGFVNGLDAERPLFKSHGIGPRFIVPETAFSKKPETIPECKNSMTVFVHSETTGKTIEVLESYFQFQVGMDIQIRHGGTSLDKSVLKVVYAIHAEGQDQLVGSLVQHVYV